MAGGQAAFLAEAAHALTALIIGFYNLNPLRFAWFSLHHVVLQVCAPGPSGLCSFTGAVLG